MSLEDRDQDRAASDSTIGGPAKTLTEHKIVIKVTSDGSISPSSYAADDGWDCACVPAPGSTFTGTVYVKYNGHTVATWPVSTTTYYTVPLPPVPPSTICVLTTGVSTASNGTINIGTHPPGVARPGK